MSNTIDNPTKEMKAYAFQEMKRLLENISRQPVQCYSQKIKGQDRQYFLGIDYVENLIQALERQYK